MADISIDGAKLTGVLRLTWNTDHLAHVLEHSQTDEPTGTWTGLACPDHGLALGTDVDNATLQRLTAHGEVADLIWEAPADLAAEHGQLLLAAIQAHQDGQSRDRRAALAAGPDPLVPGVVSELRGAQALSGRRPDPVRPGQAPALGDRLLRAPLRPARPTESPHPQRRRHRL